MTASGQPVYDLSHQGCLEKLVRVMDYDALRSEQAAMRQKGVQRGIGIATFIKGTVPSPVGWENDIRVRDDVAYLASQGSLHLLDVSTLELVQPLSIAPSKDRAWAVTGGDGYAYVASNEAGIQVLAIEADGSSEVVA